MCCKFCIFKDFKPKKTILCLLFILSYIYCTLVMIGPVLLNHFSVIKDLFFPRSVTIATQNYKKCTINLLIIIS